MAKQIGRELANEEYLEFLLEMYNAGIELAAKDVSLLVKAKLIEGTDHDFEIANAKVEDKQKYSSLSRLRKQTPEERKADERVVIIESEKLAELSDDEDNTNVENFKVKTLDSETFENLQNKALFSYDNIKQIVKADWLPGSIISHTEDFIAWINSINSGFQNMISYDKFRKYCQQAENWLTDPTIVSELSMEERRDYRINEMLRCRENTFYFLDKYFTIEGGSRATGFRRYKSKPAHKVIAYLMDCEYSLIIGKGRQMAASTTFMGIALKRLIFHKDHVIKFIAQDDDKGKDIVRTKLKYGFNNLPEWMKPNVNNDRDEVMYFSSKKAKKGSRGGVNSVITVSAPKVDAINGGSPHLAMIDEAGYIGMLGKMIKEARPTMFSPDERTGKLKMNRQVIIWGTGGTEEGEVKRKTKAYEIEYFDAMAHWQKRDFHYGIIPIFFDWTTRPGMTKELYLKEKKAYQKEEGSPEAEASLLQFRQHYPATVQDMFLSTGKLLVSATWINDQIDRIRNVPHKFKTKKGYFEPVYDYTSLAGENSDVPYKIVGATFIPLDESRDDMSRASVEIFVDPNKLWVDRYYQGTDPIMSDNGYSNMASAIYDAYFNTIAAVVNYRDSDHKYTFLQTLLLGVYYDTEGKGGVPELVESNIGTAYINYKEEKGFFNSLVHRAELPDYLSGGTSVIGIDNRGQRSRFIINKMIEMISLAGRKIYILEYFKQLTTFTCTVTQKGAEVWGVSDKRQFQDDILYGAVFAYICRLSFDRKVPQNIEGLKNNYTVRWKMVRNKDLTLSRVAERVPAR